MRVINRFFRSIIFVVITSKLTGGSPRRGIPWSFFSGRYTFLNAYAFRTIPFIGHEPIAPAEPGKREILGFLRRAIFESLFRM